MTLAEEKKIRIFVFILPYILANLGCLLSWAVKSLNGSICQKCLSSTSTIHKIESIINFPKKKQTLNKDVKFVTLTLEKTSWMITIKCVMSKMKINSNKKKAWKIVIVIPAIFLSILTQQDNKLHVN